MDNTSKEPESGSLQTGVFELPGEPAVVINGVPDVKPSQSTLGLATMVTDTESHGNAHPGAEFLENTGFGEWLEGREVLKLFGGRYYRGTVTQFDKETGWYRVEYEDGDFEDLDWHELEQLLLPLDITIPLTSLALKIIKKTQKLSNKTGSSTSRARIGKAKGTGI